MSRLPRGSMGVSIIWWGGSRAFRANRNVSACFAPRTLRSLLISSSLSALRATRKSSAPSLAKNLAVSWAMAEVAPAINTFMLKHYQFLRLSFDFCYTPPEAGGEVRINVLRKLFPPWEKGLEAAGAHTRIFGGVYCSATLQDDPVEFC